MKTTVRFLFISYFLAVLSFLAFSQTINLEETIPVDPKIRIGKLDNGLTYYLRQNQKPEKRVELRLTVNAGSILEDDTQQGLAHFVEHMAFNGTKNFEKNELISYLQSLGIKFGPDLNAYTSFDETVYMLTIPSDSVELLDKGLMVLEDWAHNITFDDEEVDKERGVIIEEWRIGRGASMRMLYQYLPVLLKDSKYAERLPIGKKEIIEKFEYQTLKSFYHDWYRPDLMALIAVGDFDMDNMENKIRERFGNLIQPSAPRKRELFDVPDHQELLVAVASDKEAPYTQIFVFHKTDKEKELTWNDYRHYLTYQIYTGMLNMRLNELREKADPPFIFAGTYYGSFLSRTKNAYQLFAVVDEKGIEKGLTAILEENERVKRYGFTEGELNRYKKDLLSQYERFYNERDKTESNILAAEFIRNYLEDEPIPGIENEYTFVKEYLPGITLNEINAISNKWLTAENRVIVVTAPEKEGVEIPSEEKIMATVENVEKSGIDAYEDKLTTTDLMEKIPAPGAIISEKKREDLDFTELKLSNGAHIALKSTDFKNDEILMTAFSPGGHSLYPDKDHLSATSVSDIINESGVGDFSNSDLNKLLAGKIVRVAPYIGYYEEGMTGNCSPKDFETMLQLMHLYFTKPRKDLESFQSFVNKQKALYKNLLSDPVTYFFDQYQRVKAQNHPRGNYIPSSEEMDKIDFNRAYEIYEDRFADAGDFTFIFIGAFDIQTIKPLIETYLGSLSSTGRKENYKDLMIRPPDDLTEFKVYKGIEPKSYVAIYMESAMRYNDLDGHRLRTLGEILNRKYYEILREEMSGVYGVGASATNQNIPYEHGWLQIRFPCSPDNTDSLTNAALKEIRNIQVSGITDKDLQKTKEIQRREKEKQIKTNNFWLNSLKSCYQTGEFGRLTDYQERIKSLNSEELQRVANKYFNLDNYTRVVLYPEQME